MTISIRPAFEERFGTEVAQAIVEAAEGHKNGVHDQSGSDPFKWAICIAVGYECLGRFAGYHGITADIDEVKEWVYYHGDLASHDGDIDYISLMAGSYEGWINQDAFTETFEATS